MLSGLVTLALVISSCRHPTSLDGYYSTTATADLVGTNYQFYPDSTFTSYGWTCMSRDTGFGHYRLTRDSLILLFDTLEAANFSRVSVDTLPGSNDSCEFLVNLHDGTEPVMFAVVAATTLNGKKYGQVADINGQARIKIPRDSFPLTLECRCVGYTTVQIRIDTPVNLKIEVNMNRSDMHVVPGGTVMAYGLQKVKRRKILLTVDYHDADGKMKTEKWILYRGKDLTKP